MLIAVALGGGLVTMLAGMFVGGLVDEAAATWTHALGFVASSSGVLLARAYTLTQVLRRLPRPDHEARASHTRPVAG